MIKGGFYFQVNFLKMKISFKIRKNKIKIFVFADFVRMLLCRQI